MIFKIRRIIAPNSQLLELKYWTKNVVCGFCWWLVFVVLLARWEHVTLQRKNLSEWHKLISFFLNTSNSRININKITVGKYITFKQTLHRILTPLPSDEIRQVFFRIEDMNRIVTKHVYISLERSKLFNFVCMSNWIMLRTFVYSDKALLNFFLNRCIFSKTSVVYKLLYWIH